MATLTLDEERTNQSALVLSSASDLVVGVIQEISGNDIATSINGVNATGKMIQTVALQRITGKLLGKA